MNLILCQYLAGRAQTFSVPRGITWSGLIGDEGPAFMMVHSPGWKIDADCPLRTPQWLWGISFRASPWANWTSLLHCGSVLTASISGKPGRNYCSLWPISRSHIVSLLPIRLKERTIYLSSWWEKCSNLSVRRIFGMEDTVVAILKKGSLPQSQVIISKQFERFIHSCMHATDIYCMWTMFQH